MFAASILVCGIWIGVDDINCIMLADKLGPFRTEENCKIRTAQMEKDIMASPYIIGVLGYPNVITVAQQCKTKNDIES